MKIEELQVGDWVHIEHRSRRLEPCNGRVRSIHEIDLVDTSDGCVDVALLEPIVLTDEILKKNGWELVDVQEGFIERFRGDLDIKRYGKGKYPWSLFEDCITINYVHELQHALRLAGIEKRIVL